MAAKDEKTRRAAWQPATATTSALARRRPSRSHEAVRVRPMSQPIRAPPPSVTTSPASTPTWCVVPALRAATDADGRDPFDVRSSLVAAAPALQARLLAVLAEGRTGE